MSHSLKPECTPLKHKYDACFNTWFEGYLQPPPGGKSESEEAQRQWQRDKRDEYERTCGKVWEGYRAYLDGALTEKGLDDLLQQAREENPLIEAEPAEARH
ncbi:hypothetical protein DACRYDRAFT_23966 [Dacryopinax primogenitus]|uniref:Uncharacterized protein n=1 Tax=Dacryopinax primogenitus (strain DJM 731) TaxID=1858805 RepID=M5FV32_DACPD|nr:uncharacterized protein DACRYDRAFT_23966 [Dacryopinax primogenitus]EJT99444.1 hypothetical protein DACRYDRAFT_23966 [Dacryopinax primogenitus]